MSVHVTSRPARAHVRRRILDAASAAFRLHGYAHASLQQIAESAGFTKGAVYSNFTSKPQLFTEVCVENVHRLGTPVVAQLEAAYTEGASNQEVIGRLATSLTGIVEEFEPWQAALGEFRQLAIHDRQVAADYESLMTAGIDQAMALLPHQELPASLGAGHTRDAMGSLLQMVNLLCLDRAAAPHVMTRERVHTTFIWLLKGLSS
jgi:AcrR family transcriptional regulator